jgi:Zinc finger, C2H2 type
MANPYKRMYVLTEEEYLHYKRLKEANPPEDLAKCSVDDRVYPNANILAHHMKTHFDGFKCNICGKVFKQKHTLTQHLKNHAPQVEPSKHSIFDSSMPEITQAPSVSQTVRLAVPSVKKKPHKQRSVLNFESSNWLTLR